MNFRDFGGLPSRYGASVQIDRLYRSGHPAGLSDEAMNRLLALDFQLVVDLRYKAEREGHEAPWPPAYADRILAHDEEGDSDAPHVRLLRDPDLDEAAIPPFYIAFYRSLPFDPPYLGLFGDFLKRLAQTEGRSLMHCSIGKDRTGLLAALVLSALGVPRDAIVADYMVSRTAPGLIDQIPEVDHILRAQLGRAISPRVAERLLLVEEDYIVAALDAIAERHGSIDAYLDTLGFDEAGREALRARLLG